MSKDSRDIAEAVRKLSGFDDMQYEHFVCTAKNIDTTKMICDCEPIDGGADFLDVRLNANYKNGFLLVPKTNSIVIISQLSDATAYVSMVSEIDNIYLGGDDFGGLVKVSELVSKINRLENAFNAHTHIASSFGSPTTPPAAPITPITTKSDLENKTIQHGKG
jgi:hypothetical protein